MPMDPHQFRTEALLQSVFRDDYRLEAARLEALYSKSKRHQWNAEVDVDWKRFEPDAPILARDFDFLARLETVNELPAARQDALFRHAALFTLSQILHGEQAALMVCGQLVNEVPDVDGKFAAAVQVMDEARHVEVFARYLARHGKRYPLDPDLRGIVERILAEPDWEAKCVGMQVILESIALGFFRIGEEMAREPVLAQFIGRVHEDESRHVAYGVLTLEERIPQLDAAARRRLEDLAYDAVVRIGGRAGKPAFATQLAALADAGIDLQHFLPRVIAEVTRPEGLDLTGVPDPLTQTVIPNLLRVGLVPERQLEGYLAQGWRIDRVAGEVGDLHSWHPEARAARQRLQERRVDFTDPAQL
jgi:hypothetical protein